MKDALRPECDLKSLRVRKLGPQRKSFGGVVQVVVSPFPEKQ